MTLGIVLNILQWVLPILKVGVASLTKANLPAEIIDAGQAAVFQLQKFLNVIEPTRAQVQSLDIDPAAWGPASTPAPAAPAK